MGITLVTVFAIFIVFLNMRGNGNALSQVKQVIRRSKYAQYEPFIINQMNLESGYITNTLSQPPLYNIFSMSTVRIRPTTQIDSYSNPQIDGGQSFGVYENYASATEDFILYLDYVRIPLGLDCQGYNEFIVSKNYAVDPLYLSKLNAMCK